MASTLHLCPPPDCHPPEGSHPPKTPALGLRGAGMLLRADVAQCRFAGRNEPNPSRPAVGAGFHFHLYALFTLSQGPGPNEGGGGAVPL